jgi:hypothetical protein
MVEAFDLGILLVSITRRRYCLSEILYCYGGNSLQPCHFTAGVGTTVNSRSIRG